MGSRSAEPPERTPPPPADRSSKINGRSVTRPPLADFLAYLEGSLVGVARAAFEQYLARNREARRRVRQLARLDEMLQQGLIVDSIVADARTWARAEADNAREGRVRLDSAGVEPLPGDDPAIDETLVAAWVDGALTADERLELAARLLDPAAAASFLRQAHDARRATDKLPPGGSAEAGGGVAASPASSSTSQISVVARPGVGSTPAPEPVNGDLGGSDSDDGGDGRSGAVPITASGRVPRPLARLGRLLLHRSKTAVVVLDAAPRREPGSVEQLDGGLTIVRLVFNHYTFDLTVRPTFRAVELVLTAGGAQPPARVVLTDEASRRMFEANLDRKGAEGATTAVTFPPLRPGVYHVIAYPSRTSMLVCVNGELGTTEVHRLHE